MKFIPQFLDYAVEVDEKDFVECIINEDELLLYDRLNEIDGVTGVEYDGHFGPFIYFSVDLDKDVPAILEQVKKTIERHIDETD